MTTDTSQPDNDSDKSRVDEYVATQLQQAQVELAQLQTEVDQLVQQVISNTATTETKEDAR